jgi:hypothetical protein
MIRSNDAQKGVCSIDCVCESIEKTASLRGEKACCLFDLLRPHPSCSYHRRNQETRRVRYVSEHGVVSLTELAGSGSDEEGSVGEDVSY